MSADPLPAAPTPPARDQRLLWGCLSIVIVIMFCIALTMIPPFVDAFMNSKITIFVGVAFVGVAGWLAQQEHAWLCKAQVVPGTVTELIPVRGSKGSVSYKPRVQYSTVEGVAREFVRPYSSSPAGVRVGQSVAIAYDAAAADDARIVTFGQRYGFAACLAVIGISLILLALAFLFGNQYVPRAYLHGGTLTETSRGW